MKKQTKKTGIFLLLLLLVVTLCACKNEQIQPTESPVPTAQTVSGPPITVITDGSDLSGAIKTGAEKAGTDLGAVVTVKSPSNPSDSDEQLDLLDQALADNPAAICIAAIDAAAVMPFLERAQKLGIPVIGIGNVDLGDIASATCATDNTAAGATVAEKMAEHMNGQGQIGLLLGNETTPGDAAFRDGFADFITENHPNMEIVSIQYHGDEDPSTISMDMIESYPDIKGIFSTTPQGVNAVSATVKDKGSDLVIIGFDSGKQQIQDIRDGIQTGAITQNSVNMGYMSIDAALKSIRGQTPEATIDTGAIWYDKNNIDSDQIKPLLHQ